MDFDEILDEIGEFGKYQKTNYLLLCFPVLFAAANSLSYVFTAGIPNYRCFIPECDNFHEPIYDQPWVHYAVPGTRNLDGIFKPQQCEYFIKNNFTQNDLEITYNHDTCPAHWFSQKIDYCNDWVFDNDERTIVQDWSITCPENQWKLALVGTMHFVGIIVGSGGFGLLADRFGRKLVFIFCILFMSITGVGQGFATDYITFIIFAFLNAVGTSGVYPLAFIIGVEMVGRKKREMSGIVLNYFYAIGEAAVGIIMWLCRDWVSLQIIVSAPPILFLFYYWFVPESVRWLLAKKKNNQANEIIKKAAKINGVILSDTILANLNDESDSDSCTKSLHKNSKIENNMSSTFKAVFTSKVMLSRIVILCFNWASTAFVYYGLSLNSTNLNGNKYLNFILVCLVEIPGYTLAWILMNKMGRRWALAASFLLCSFTCILSAFITQGTTWILITLFLTGKLGITSSFGIIYVHTAEMLPTIIRSGGVGVMSTVARFGATVAPFVPLLGIYMEALPLLLFGIVSFMAGLLTLILPETLGRKLPETVEEAESLNKDEFNKEEFI